MCTSNVNDRRLARKEYSIVLAAHNYNSDNITNRATKYEAQKHKHRNAMIKNIAKQNIKTQKSVQLCSIMKIPY